MCLHCVQVRLLSVIRFRVFNAAKSSSLSKTKPSRADPFVLIMASLQEESGLAFAASFEPSSALSLCPHGRDLVCAGVQLARRAKARHVSHPCSTPTKPSNPARINVTSVAVSLLH
jgi:hypothetical protein